MTLDKSGLSVQINNLPSASDAELEIDTRQIVEYTKEVINVRKTIWFIPIDNISVTEPEVPELYQNDRR